MYCTPLISKVISALPCSEYALSPAKETHWIEQRPHAPL